MKNESNPMNVGVIGLGNLGTAIGNLVAGNGHDVLGWEYSAPAVEEINRDHTSARFLPGVALSPRLEATGHLPDALERADVLFVALPSAFIRPTLESARSH